MMEKEFGDEIFKREKNIDREKGDAKLLQAGVQKFD
jgi:hypothetical protein